MLNRWVKEWKGRNHIACHKNDNFRWLKKYRYSLNNKRDVQNLTYESLYKGCRRKTRTHDNDRNQFGVSSSCRHLHIYLFDQLLKKLGWKEESLHVFLLNMWLNTMMDNLVGVTVGRNNLIVGLETCVCRQWYVWELSCMISALPIVVCYFAYNKSSLRS